MGNHKTIFRLNCTVIVHTLFTQYDSQGFEISVTFMAVFSLYSVNVENFFYYEKTKPGHYGRTYWKISPEPRANVYFELEDYQPLRGMVLIFVWYKNTLVNSKTFISVRCIWLYVLVMSRTRFRVNPHSIVAWMSRNTLLKAREKSEGEGTATGLEPRTT